MVRWYGGKVVRCVYLGYDHAEPMQGEDRDGGNEQQNVVLRVDACEAGGDVDEHGNCATVPKG